ncbi:MAG TPA: hypothetical protein VGF45_13015 [Polyangia bacterium]
MGQGKDRGKHDGGRDASGQYAPGEKHPESPRNSMSGSSTDEDEARMERGRSAREKNESREENDESAESEE